MSRHRSLLVAIAATLLAPACILDFGKFEGEVPPVTTSVGGSGAGPATSAGGSGGDGGQGGMVPVECTNMVQDGMETAVDCGGPDCPGCAN